MKKRSIAAVLAAALLGAACASPYGPSVLFGGYRDTRVDDSHYVVRFDGNGHSSKERVWSFWIYRCAELTKQQGYAYFTLEPPPSTSAAQPDGGDGRVSGLAQTQPAPRRFASYRPDDAGDGAPRMIQTAGHYVSVPIYIPGGTIRTWHTNATVAMYNDPLPDGLVVLRAQTVLNSLAPYIASNGATKPVSREEIFSSAAVSRNAARSL
jgi:hypothetical protein